MSNKSSPGQKGSRQDAPGLEAKSDLNFTVEDLFRGRIITPQFKGTLISEVIPVDAILPVFLADAQFLKRMLQYLF